MGAYDAFKAQLDIVTVAERLSDGEVKRGGRGGKMGCPNPDHEDRHPSTTLYDDGHFHCFVCGADGDVIELVRLLRGSVSFGEAVDWLAEEFRLERPHRDPEAAARAAALRAVREALRDGRAATSLPGGLPPGLADRLGLGRAVGLNETLAELPRRLLSVTEAGRWEGAWTLELEANLRSGVIGFGAFIPQPPLDEPVFEESEEEDDTSAGLFVAASPPVDPLPDPVPETNFEAATAVSGIWWAGLSSARASLARTKTVLFTPSVNEMLALQIDGFSTAISPGRRLDGAVANSLADLAPRVIVVATAERQRSGDFASGLFALLSAGRRVEIVARRQAGLGTPVPLFTYIAKVAERRSGIERTGLLDAYLGAVASPSSRALYAAELRRRTLLD